MPCITDVNFTIINLRRLYVYKNKSFFTLQFTNSKYPPVSYILIPKIFETLEVLKSINKRFGVGTMSLCYEKGVIPCFTMCLELICVMVEIKFAFHSSSRILAPFRAHRTWTVSLFGLFLLTNKIYPCCFLRGRNQSPLIRESVFLNR